MVITTAIVVLVTSAANIGIALADLARAKFVLENSAAVNVPRRWLPLLAALKAAGGLALLLWFAGASVLPVLAAGGLVCFFAGALVVHVRAGVYGNIAFPGAYFVLAAASLVLMLMQTGG